MNKERQKEKLAEILKRMINGERFEVDEAEIYYDPDLLLSNNVGPFVCRHDFGDKTNLGIAPKEYLKRIIVRESPWYKECKYPVLCYVSDEDKIPDSSNDLLLIVGRETAKSGKSWFKADDCSEWNYATPVPKDRAQQWLYDEDE